MEQQPPRLSLLGGPLGERLWRLRERWETESRFRATMSAALAVVVLLSLCSCMLVAGIVTSRVFGTVAGTNGGNNPSLGQSGQGMSGTTLQGGESFPTATVLLIIGPSPQPQPIPTSGTPEPSPTPLPTATPVPTPTPCQTNCGGGGGGGGGHGTVTVTGHSPLTWTTNGTDTLSVHTSVPNDGVNMIIQFPAGSTILSVDLRFSGTDSSGNGTLSFVPSQHGASCSGGGQATANVSEQHGGSTAVDIPCS